VKSESIRALARRLQRATVLSKRCLRRTPRPSRSSITRQPATMMAAKIFSSTVGYLRACGDGTSQ
jgi:hypothetical protein